MRDIGPVTKSQTNTLQGFKFRGVDNFINALHPALVKHGVFMAPRTVNYSHELKDVTRKDGKAGVDKHVSILVEYDFFAEDGSKVTVGPIAAEGLDSGDKATNKALSAALKYALIQTFSVPTEDMEEADRTSPEIGSSLKTTIAINTPATSLPNNSVSASSASSETSSSAPKKTTFRRVSKPATSVVVSNGSANSSPSSGGDDAWGN